MGNEIVNNIVSILQVNYHELEPDVKKEQQLRQKIGYTQQDSAHFHSLPNGLILGFERADVTRKVRVVLSELFFIQTQIQEQLQSGIKASEIVIKTSELFDNDIYLEEIADILCIALAELPSLLTVQDVVDTLLYVNNGTSIICWVVGNMPDCFKEIVSNLIINSDEETPLRLAALNALCEMNPAQALSTRTLCVELLKMPSLMINLSLKDPQDLISFVTGLLLGNDQNIRGWVLIYYLIKASIYILKNL